MPLVATRDEGELRRAWDAGDYHMVTALALERYGKEIFGMLAAKLRSRSDAEDVFALFVEALWRGLQGFQWRSSLRAWAHRIARNAATRWAAGCERDPRRHVPIERAGVLDLAAPSPSSTLAHLRSEVKSQIRRLREELPEADQLLLILRVDKGLEWDEVVAALGDEDVTPEELKREASRLRKRFQLVTEKLRSLARERGILDS